MLFFVVESEVNFEASDAFILVLVVGDVGDAPEVASAVGGMRAVVAESEVAMHELDIFEGSDGVGDFHGIFILLEFLYIWRFVCGRTGFGQTRTTLYLYI